MKDLLYLNNIKESVKLIEDYLKGKSFSDLESSYLLRDGVCKRMEEIGENMKKVSLKIKKSYPDIKWKDFIDMRDFLSHVYQMVNMKKLWVILEKELPLLKNQINNLMEDIRDDK